MLRTLLMFLVLATSSLTLAEDQQKPLVLNSYTDAHNAMKKYNAHGIFVFHAKWCAPCRKMQTESWTPLMPILKKNYIVYFVDIDVETDIVTKWKQQGRLQNGIPAYAMTTRGGSKLMLYGEGYRDKNTFIQWFNNGIRKLQPPGSG